jgi:transposase
MSQKSAKPPSALERLVRDIRRATRKQYTAEEKIRIVLDGLRREISVAELCRREGIAESMYYSWSKEFLEAGKRRLGRRPGTSRDQRRACEERLALSELLEKAGAAISCEAWRRRCCSC